MIGAIAKEVAVPRDGILGALLGTTFEQSFVARCSGLSEIDLSFGLTGPAGSQTVHIELREEETGKVVARFALDASEIVDSGAPDAVTRVAVLESGRTQAACR